MKSIRRDLLVWLLTGLTLAIVAASIGTYLRARVEANALFDYELKEMAASLTDAPFAPGPVGSTALGPGSNALLVQIWDRHGVQLYLSQPHRVLPQNAQLGFTTIATDAGSWRVFSTLADGQVVQVAQPMSARRDLAASMALRTVMPLLIALPILAVLIWLTIARGLRPLERVADAVARRSSSALEPLGDAHLPSEVQPLVSALNGLLGRLHHALDTQRSFIADAAHELRTPLTAIHLQAQLAERATNDGERSVALSDLKGGLERATRLVEQLLTLAREEPGVAAPALHSADLSILARNVVTDLAPLAGAKRIDLGLKAETPVFVRGNADALTTLISNLVDNALRYTPVDGRVDVVVTNEHGKPQLAVRDSGPGIAESERARVFDRFYRGTSAGDVARGSGLGLAIVKRIADRHDAVIEVGDGIGGIGGPGDRGAGIQLTFPPFSPNAASTSVSPSPVTK